MSIDVSNTVQRTCGYIGFAPARNPADVELADRVNGLLDIIKERKSVDMSSDELKKLVEEYRRIKGLSVNDGTNMYVQLLEDFMNNKEYFESQIAEMKQEIEEYDD